MISKIVGDIKAGKILAVDWQNIQEMLGEDMNLKIECSICGNSNMFPPVAEEVFEFSERDVMEIIRQAGVNYINGTPLSRFKTRYFAVERPQAGQWLEVPIPEPARK